MERRVRAWLVVFAAAGLAGCMPLAGPSPEALANLKQERAACHDKFARQVPRAQCVNQAIDKAYGPDFHYRDLVELNEAQRLALAEQIDAGKITPAEGEAAMAKMTVEINSEAQRRATNAAMAIEASRPVSCYSYGSVTNCY